jgi:NADPH:quinone reductase-like Zn-dependent oxidoreductase
MKAFAKPTGMNSPVELIDNLSRPEAGDNEMLVKIGAIGVGIHDEYFHAPDVTYPYAIGIEGAGIVEDVGKAVTECKTGDRLTFVSMMQPKGGTWAEYAVVSKDSLILHIPDTMTFEQAAAFPVAGNTVLKALHQADLRPDQSLFIAGGAGALGTFLIQIAAKRGYTIIASASKKNHEYMKELGANHTVDYHDSDWQQQVRTLLPDGVDAAIAIHPGTPIESQPVVKDGGVLVAVSGDNFATERGIILKGVFNTIDIKEELQDLLSKVASGEITQTIDKVYPFVKALDALEQVKTRHTRGKLVLSLVSSNLQPKS